MKKYFLENLDCANCALKLESNLDKLDIVRYVSIDFSTLSMIIDTDYIKKVQEEIKILAPDVTIKEEKDDSKESFKPGKELIITGTALLIYLITLVLHKNISAYYLDNVIFITIYLFFGWKIFIKAFKSLKNGGILDENFLMSIATLGAIAINAFSEAAGVMLFFRIGEYLQELSIYRSRRSIKALLAIRPDYANLLVNSEVKKVSPDHVAIGDTIIVKAGEKIPLDSEVISGNSYIDTSALTGEPVPKNVSIGDQVMAGMINKSGLLKLKVTKIFEESSIAKIMELVENATHKKAKTEMFFTTFARYYTPVIVVLAILTATIPPLIISDQSFSDWIYRALVILVISCPCALVVSIPLTYFGGIGAASKQGILIKGSCFLDTLNQVKSFVFDKTGTLSKGVFKVNKIHTQGEFSEHELLELVAETEAHSNHPIATSIIEYYDKKPDLSRINNYKEISGMGIVAEILLPNNSEILNVLCGNEKLMRLNNISFEHQNIPETIVHIAVNSRYQGYITISDEIKKEAKHSLNALKKTGINDFHILTGDNKEITSSLAKKLEINNYHSELLPEEKLNHLENILNKNKNIGKTVFVGDGINDAPVLARADIGISMGLGGTDVAIETADIIIMNDNLEKLPVAVKIAKKTKHIIIQNIILALGVKSLFIVLGFLGIATMWEAVFGDVGVTLIAVFNAGRILKYK